MSEETSTTKDELIAEIIAAWNNAGAMPWFHIEAQKRLIKNWPSLGRPIKELAELKGD